MCGEIGQQPAEEGRIGTRCNRQKQVGIVSRRGAARIDHHDPGAALALVCDHPLVQHRMAPGGVRSDQHDEVGAVDIFISARHGVGPERAPLSGDRGCHAEPGIGVDIRRADEALHQLVGDVVVLGQQLAGEIKRDGAGTVPRDDLLEAVRDRRERRIPSDPRQRAIALPAHRMQKPTIKRKRFAKGRSFGAQPSEICRMIRIGRNHRAAAAIRLRQHAAADAAIRTGGTDRRQMAGCVHCCFA